jgi:hypothetical protein
LARRIAAALSAPNSIGERHFKFHWVTAVTTSGEIAVANSYGMAYLPDKARLPERVHMASADDEIPPAERARWATYPLIALRGWADHHGHELRAVIATEEGFGDSDPGVTKIVLEADDIPETGEMTGRSRLAVADPKAATLLASTPDDKLLELLTPAPADESVPDEELPMLWIEVTVPLLSAESGREHAHLEAFRTFAFHTQHAVLTRARAAVGADVQRSAVADWLYWKYLTALHDAALADPVYVQRVAEL